MRRPRIERRRPQLDWAPWSLAENPPQREGGNLTFCAEFHRITGGAELQAAGEDDYS